jgi:hypothetical protein
MEALRFWKTVAVDDANLIERLVGLLDAEDIDYCVIGGQGGLKLSLPGSALRVRIQTDPRYAPFVAGAERRNVLGLSMPVAKLEDVLRGKVWAAQDPARRPSKRQRT